MSNIYETPVVTDISESDSEITPQCIGAAAIVAVAIAAGVWDVGVVLNAAAAVNAVKWVNIT